AVKTSTPCGPVASAPVPVDVLYRDHQPWLFRWLRGRLGSPFRAEHLAQAGFVRVLGGRKQVHAAQARPLLRTIAHGLLLDHYRRASLEQAYLGYPPAPPQPPQPSAEQRAAGVQQVAALDRMLAGLPDNVRRAFLLAHPDALPYADTATRLGVSLSSVQQYM